MMFDATVETPVENDAHVNDGVTAEAASEPEAPVAAEPAAEEKYKELYDQHLRLAADFENFRKNTRQEREALLKYGAQNTIECLLPVLDNLERGASSLSVNSEPKLLYQSFTMLANQLLSELDSTGLKKMITEGQVFDPTRHEAVDQVVTSDVAENTIVHQLQSGYTLHDRVIRVAQVAVAVAPSATEETPAEPAFTTQANNPFTSVEA